MNREEIDHGCSPEEESEEVEIQKEGKEGRAEKEKSRATLQSEEEGGSEKEESRAEEGCGQKEIRTQESRAQESSAEEARRAEAARGSTASSARGVRSCRDAEPDHLSPVQPAGGRRKFG
jgi:hypothetical protein